MRVALFGGTFDPSHRGHRALARLAKDRLHLDLVLIAPVGTQPLKQEATTASFEDRMEMARLAFANEPEMEVSLIDAPRTDGRANYTIDTVLELKRGLKAEDRLFCLMGADSFLTIGKWYRAAELLVACDFIVGSRLGFDLGRLATALPEKISVAAEEADLPGCLVLGLRGTGGGHSRLYLLPDLAEDVSATEVRAALSQGAHTAPGGRPVLDPAVARYIHEHRIYG
ncbi:MAG TPA: nicotinate (nicotinamide) nucleotide adenylyltransferase [Silvibacterium sp.]|jgi:nicotinate-nucleotide adenylyltransferase|nr:nicotinate (nicotinamide) nucleotide adenylyltransferase [Silvibacterium sp.]